MKTFRKRGSVVRAFKWDGSFPNDYVRQHKLSEEGLFRATGLGLVTMSAGSGVVRPGEWVTVNEDGTCGHMDEFTFNYNFEEVV